MQFAARVAARASLKSASERADAAPVRSGLTTQRRRAVRPSLRRDAAWLMLEMQMGDGGYCFSLDADSEGEGGRF